MKKIYNNLILIILSITLISIFINKKEVNTSIIYSYTLFTKVLFPNMFPFLVISGLLINYNFVEICSKIFNKSMKLLFNVSGNASFIFFTSLLSGTPSNAKYTKDLYLKKYISFEEATKILTFTHFTNPLFIVGTTSTFLPLKISYIILLVHYLTNIIIGILFRNIYGYTINKNITNKHISFGNCLTSSIKDSINTLLLIFGTVTVFLIISSIIPIHNIFFKAILEVTQGINLVGATIISNKLKAVLFTFLLSFGGLSIHMQVISILSDTNIKYYPYLLARILHATISSLIIFLIL